MVMFLIEFWLIFCWVSRVPQHAAIPGGAEH